jgi:hypothetical protein
MALVFGINEKALDGCADPKQLPAWLKPEDLYYYANDYSRTGFRGGLNWYRAQEFLARDAVSDRAQAAAADVAYRRNRGPRGRVRKALR